MQKAAVLAAVNGGMTLAEVKVQYATLGEGIALYEADLAKATPRRGSGSAQPARLSARPVI
jgi:hypothetical protein